MQDYSHDYRNSQFAKKLAGTESLPGTTSTNHDYPAYRQKGRMLNTIEGY
jgi:hypothetical protein